MAKKVWILNHHATNMYFDNGGRHYCIAKYLKRKGYEPIIVCANAEHGTGKKCFDNEDLFSVHINTQIDVPFIFVKSRTYTNNGKDRIMGMFDYYFNVKKIAKEIVERYGKPDVIIGSSVHPLACLAGIKLSKKYGSKCITEIRDLWPESIVAYGLAKKDNPFIKILYRFERYLYEKSDAVIFTMAGGKDYIKEKGWDLSNGGKIDLDKIFHINNGVDFEKYEYNRQHYYFDDADLENSEKIKIVYTGSIRLTNHVERIVEVARKMQNENYIFLIFGSGDKKEDIKSKISEYRLQNIILKEPVEKKYIPYILSKADICITDVCNDAIFRFGISPNKLFEYMASGKPVLSCLPCGYDILQYLDAGMTVDGENVNNIVDAIRIIKSKIDSNQYKEMNDRVNNEISFEKHTEKLINIIEN